VNKTPARAASKKSVAPRPAASAKKAVKPASGGRPAGKAAPKTPAKPAAKAAPKTAAKTTKPSAAATRKPATPPVPKKPAAKPSAKPPAKPAAKLPPKSSSPVSKTKTSTPGAAIAKAADKPTPKPAPVAAESTPPKRSAQAAAQPIAPAPLPAPTSRFADRFAPPRPPTRQMNNLEVDTPRQAQKADPKLANAWKSKAGKDLTEAEVLAMPESEYMNEKQLEFFRIKLQQLKDDLLSNAGETTEHLREDTSIVPDPADRATIEEEHALELRTRDRERKLLKKISQSLARIEAGDYGFCDETGEPIGLGRLIARPTATLSLEAQQRRELKQKMFGD
jgi:DnaK suppressor protein